VHAAAYLEVARAAGGEWACCDGFIDAIISDSPGDWLEELADKRLFSTRFAMPGVIGWGPCLMHWLIFFSANKCLRRCARICVDMADGCGRTRSHFLAAAPDGWCIDFIGPMDYGARDYAGHFPADVASEFGRIHALEDLDSAVHCSDDILWPFCRATSGRRRRCPACRE
jgi:hypothetical protein